MRPYAQRRGSPGAVPVGPLHLRPPLRLIWSFEGVSAEPLVVGDLCAVWAGSQKALVCLDRGGLERWRVPCEYVRFALSPEEIIAVVRTMTGMSTFLVLQPDTGARVWSHACEYHVDKVCQRRKVFVGSTLLDSEPGVTESVVAAVGWTDKTLELQWTSVTRYRDGEFPRRSYDWDIACDDSRVFVGRGNDLVALDLDSGREVWTAPLTSLGGGWSTPGGWIPMVSMGHLVINTQGGTACFSTEDGGVRWLFPRVGTRTVYDGRVYLVSAGTYHILDLKTGEHILTSPLAERTEKMWRLRSVGFPTQLAVSETHAFLGDYRGRLYAFARDTGEPVWMDHPEGISGFTGNIPVIAGNRLHISSSSMDPASPPRLYCYEGVE
jgi:outer membrane protein assembly factor BamB